MRLSKLQAYGAVLTASLTVLGLAACVQDGRQAALPPQHAHNGFGLFYMDEGPSVKLAYGAANSDDVGFMLQCAKGSRRVSVSDVSRGGGKPSLTLASGNQKAVMSATLADGDGAPLLTVAMPSDILPLRAFRRSGEIRVGNGGAQYDVVASATEKAGVERFFAACERAA